MIYKSKRELCSLLATARTERDTLLGECADLRHQLVEACQEHLATIGQAKAGLVALEAKVDSWPDLLAACTGALKELEHLAGLASEMEGYTDSEPMEVCRAAIAKAVPNE